MATLRSGFFHYDSSNDQSQNFRTSPTPNLRVRASTATLLGRRPTPMVINQNPKSHVPLIDNNTITGEIDNLLSLFDSSSYSDCRQIHAQFVKLNALHSSTLLRKKLATIYARNKDFLECGQNVFDEMPERSLSTYAELIASYSQLGQWESIFYMFSLMVLGDLLPNSYMIPSILKACSAVQKIRSGKMVHGYCIRIGLDSDVFIGNSLIDFYANFGDLRSSTNVFDTLHVKNVVSWTAILSAYMNNDLLVKATSLFHSMEANRVKPDLITWNALVSTLARKGEIGLALHYFEEMQKQGLKPRVNSWNGIISGCVQRGNFQQGLAIFSQMLRFPEIPNIITIVSVLPACAGVKDLNLGRSFHGYSLKHDLCDNLHFDSSLVDMYLKCGKNSYAKIVFFSARKKTTAMCNEIIAAYVNEGNKVEALRLLKLMQQDLCEPDQVSFNTIIAGYARDGRINKSYELLVMMNQMGVKPNIVTCNVLISGFQQSGLSYEALKIFQIVHSPSCSRLFNLVFNSAVRPNSVTVIGGLAACGDLQLRCQGKEIHGYLLKYGFETNYYISSALVDMYTRCRDIRSATKVFRRMDRRICV